MSRQMVVIQNRFDYYEPLVFVDEPVDNPQNTSAPTLLQPKVPTSMAEKQRAKCADDLKQTIADLNQPPQPLPEKVQWTRDTAPLILTMSRSRTDLLSEKIARRGG